MISLIQIDSLWVDDGTDMHGYSRSLPAASVSGVSLLGGSPWWPPPDTGEDREEGAEPLASESSLGWET